MTRPLTTESDLRAIAAIDEPILRNLRITQAYAELSHRMHSVFDPTNHTWCTFAVWASATAGQSIRQEEVPRWVVRLRVFDGALDTVSRHLGHGNKQVFAELAPLYLAFIELIESAGGAAIGDDDVAGAIRGASGGTVDDGVLAAFVWYGRSRNAPDPSSRAWAVLAANVLAVAHEQRRLQADIAAAMNAGISIEMSVEERGDAPRFGLDLTQLWDELVTMLLMALRVPGAHLRLDADIPALADGRRFPIDLDIGSGADSDRAAAESVYQQWDRTAGTGDHDRAADWCELDQRMNFIVNLFRSRQQDRSMAAMPFTPDQVAAMLAGGVPKPPLLPPDHLVAR